MIYVSMSYQQHSEETCRIHMQRYFKFRIQNLGKKCLTSQPYRKHNQTKPETTSCFHHTSSLYYCKRTLTLIFQATTHMPRSPFALKPHIRHHTSSKTWTLKPLNQVGKKDSSDHSSNILLYRTVHTVINNWFFKNLM